MGELLFEVLDRAGFFPLPKVETQNNPSLLIGYAYLWQSGELDGESGAQD